MAILTGDFAKLERVARALRDACGSGKLKTLNKSLAEDSVNLVKDGFASGSDPYDKPWNAPNNLQITGRMKAYKPTQISSRGFKISATDEKAIWHHSPRKRPLWGGKALPTRMQVPKKGDLPPKWKSQLEETAEAFLALQYRRAIAS